ncbi:hypothetical protein CW304_13170 [Bacillus sp. UFRGS-B20]|nr:hypothetical protein CW304_13170 [Bacillus sp. UFRGS-B20]
MYNKKRNGCSLLVHPGLLTVLLSFHYLLLTISRCPRCVILIRLISSYRFDDILAYTSLI